MLWGGDSSGVALLLFLMCFPPPTSSRGPGHSTQAFGVTPPYTSPSHYGISTSRSDLPPAKVGIGLADHSLSTSPGPYQGLCPQVEAEEGKILLPALSYSSSGPPNIPGQVCCTHFAGVDTETQRKEMTSSLDHTASQGQSWNWTSSPLTPPGCALSAPLATLL